VAVSFHENFWVVTGTAAPVIALAAVAALPDATKAVVRAYERPFVPLSTGELRMVTLSSGETALTTDGKFVSQVLSAKAATIRTRTLINVIVQAGLLAVSLSALAAQRNVMPPWIAIVLATGGILLLAWTLWRGATLKKTMDKLDKEPRDREQEPGGTPARARNSAMRPQQSAAGRIAYRQRPLPGAGWVIVPPPRGGGRWRRVVRRDVKSAGESRGSAQWSACGNPPTQAAVG